MDIKVARFLIIIWLITLLVFFFYDMENTLFYDDEVAKRVHVWIQFFSSSWPRMEEVKLDRQSVGFAAGITFRFALFLFQVGGIVLILWELITRERREVVKFIDILRVRDRAIKNQLISATPPDLRGQERAKLDEAFEKGSKRWAQEHLPNLVGKEHAERMLKQMESE